MATAEHVHQVLAGYRFLFERERELQDGIAEALTRAGLGFEREERLTPTEIPDFLVTGGVALEVKTTGGWTAVFSQLQRYALSPRVTSVLLVTRRARHAFQMPPTVAGKPLCVLTLGDASL